MQCYAILAEPEAARITQLSRELCKSGKRHCMHRYNLLLSAWCFTPAMDKKLLVCETTVIYSGVLIWHGTEIFDVPVHKDWTSLV